MRGRSGDRSRSTQVQQTDANHCTAACTSTICNCPRLVQSKISIVCELSTAFLRAASTGGEHAVHAVCRVRYTCVRACLAAHGLAWDTNQVQRRQRPRRRARPPSSLRRCCERSLPAHAECTRQSSAVHAFALIFGKANRCHCEMPIWRCNASATPQPKRICDNCMSPPNAHTRPWGANKVGCIRCYPPSAARAH